MCAPAPAFNLLNSRVAGFSPPCVSAAMTENSSPEKLNQAVESCVRRCCISNAPLALLSTFRKQLAADPEWRPEEIVAVERRVVSLVKNVLVVE